jgi:catalase
MNSALLIPALWLSAVAGATAVFSTPVVAQVDPSRMVDAFERASGKFEGFRRSGAKGVCAAGEFVGSAEGRSLSVSSAFSGNPVPVTVRFSVGGANPKAPDNARSQRNMALQFDLPGGETWQMGNISAPIFGSATPEQMLGRLESLTPDPETKRPNPEKVKAFRDANPEVLLQGKYYASQPVPAGFDKVNYWGVHAFAFVDASGKKQYGKWVFEPVGGTQSLSDEEAKAKGSDFLIDELRQRVPAGNVAFDFNLQLAEPGDNLDSAVTPLPQDRKKVTLGRLTVKSVSADSTGSCVTVTYNPMICPRASSPRPTRCLPPAPRLTQCRWVAVWSKGPSSNASSSLPQGRAAAETGAGEGALAALPLHQALLGAGSLAITLISN